MNSDNLPTKDKIRIAAVVGIGILIIAVVSYIVFDMPAWAAIAGGFVAILINGIAMLFGKQPK